ncbi:MAG: hypothetical protein FJ363_06740 [Gemmatimonadetes bacterium]|nr:hypothetical protein [Gemmatimonadota bacterium]
MPQDDLFKRPYPDENYVPPNEADLRKQALQRAYEIAQSITTDQAREAMAKQAKPPVDRGPLLRAVNAGLTVAIAGWMLFAPPPWLPRLQTPARPAEQRVVALRLTLALDAARIIAFRDAVGRLPETLAEAGGDVRNGVRYVVVDADRFTLAASDGAASVTYDSIESLNALLSGGGPSR